MGKVEISLPGLCFFSVPCSSYRSAHINCIIQMTKLQPWLCCLPFSPVLCGKVNDFCSSTPTWQAQLKCYRSAQAKKTGLSNYSFWMEGILNSLCLLNVACWETDHHSWGVPEHSAQKAEGHLWEVRQAHLFCSHKLARGFTHFKCSLPTKEKKKILRREWTRSDRRRSVRQNPKTRTSQRSKFLTFNVLFFLFGH